ncbi:MAG TPA: hypothetical protein PKC38_09855 [Chitinophagales bacterium]|nr:hypothetical protein [Chitinophagales bacterium]
MRIRPVLMIIFVSLCVVHSYAQPLQIINSTTKPLLTNYYDAVERADTLKALHALNGLINEDPDFPYYYIARASIHIALGNIPQDSILIDYERAIERAPDDITVLSQQAVYTGQFHSDNMRIIAMNDRLSLVQLDSLNYNHYEACNNYVLSKDEALITAFYQQATRAMFQMVTMYPDSSDTWYHLANVISWNYAFNGNSEMLLKALSYYDKAIQLNPANTAFYIARATLFAKSKDWENAIEDYKQAMSLSSRADWFLELGLLYEHIGEKQKAKNAFNTGLQFYPDNYLLRRAKKQLH